MSKNKKLGNQGEDFAVLWLQKKGYKIVSRNIHSQAGEVDILTFNSRRSLYVAFEVKTRRSSAFGSGLESITPSKIQKIEKALIHYFLNIVKLKKLPEYEIQALVLKPNKKTGLFQPRFVVDHYEDLS